jgi:AraC-like DNA-binding protein
MGSFGLPRQVEACQVSVIGGHDVTGVPAESLELTCAEPSVPAVYALHLAQAVRLCGGSDSQLLAELNVPADALADPSARLSFARMSALVERAIALSGEPALGALLGWNTSISNFGAPGFAALSAPTLRQAIEIGVRFVPLITSVVRLQLAVERDSASVELEEQHPLGDVRDFTAFAVLIGLARVGEALTGRALFGDLELAFPEPAYCAGFPPRENTRLCFDQPRHRLVFDRAYLELPVITADPAAYRTALELCERQLVEREPGALLVQRVNRSLFAADGGGIQTPAQVARALGMAERTLKRKLAEQGTSYSALLDRQRQTRALELLRTEASIDAVAERLGYSDAANFTRAFRRWTGKSPRAVRKAARG